MKAPHPVHVYKGNEFIKHFNTLIEASNYTNDSVPSIRYSIANKRPTRRGYFYTNIDDKLTKEELEEIFKEVRQRGKKPNKPIKETKNEEAELTFYFHAQREKKKEQLKQWIAHKMQKDWLTMPIQLAKMERKFVRNLIDSI